MTLEQQAALDAVRARLATAAPSFNPAQQAALDAVRARLKGDDDEGGFLSDLGKAYQGNAESPTTKRGGILPIARDEGRDVRFGAPQFLMDILARATGPGRGAADLLGIDKKSIGFDDAPEFDPVKEGRGLAATLSGMGVSVPLGKAAIGLPIVGDAATLAMNAVGPPIKAAGKAVANVASTLAEPLASRVNPDTYIGRVLAKRMEQQNPGVTPEAALAATRAKDAELGPAAVLADTGENMARLARNMTQGPGETAQRAKDVLGGRQAEEKTRMIGSLKENISPTDFYDANAEAELGMKAADPHFKAAFKANPSVSSPVLDKLLKTPAGKDAMAFARERIENRMSKMANPDPELTEQLNELVARGEAAPSPGGVASGLKLETHDLIRQDLYDQMQLMKKKVAMGTARKGEYNEIKGIYSQYRQELLDHDITARAGPNSTRTGQYELGLNKYKDSAKLQEALEAGRSFMRGDPEELEMGFEKLSTKEQDAYRTGVVKEAVEMIGRNTTEQTPAQIMSALQKESSVRKKLEAIAPTPEQFGKIMKDIENNLRFRETNRTARNVSQTGSIAMEEGQIAGDTLQALGGTAGDVLKGNKEQAFARAMNWGLGQLRKIQMPQTTRDRIGKLLLSQDQGDKEEAFRLIQAAQNGGKSP